MSTPSSGRHWLWSQLSEFGQLYVRTLLLARKKVDHPLLDLTDRTAVVIGGARAPFC
jgi:hypothetical protein